MNRPPDFDRSPRLSPEELHDAAARILNHEGVVTVSARPADPEVDQPLKEFIDTPTYDYLASQINKL